MDIQKFIQDNIPEVDSREEFAKYKTLKDRAQARTTEGERRFCNTEQEQGTDSGYK